MITNILISIVNAYIILIIIYTLMSWLPTKSGILKQINDALAVLCEGYLGIFRRFIPPIGGVVDISPIVAILVLYLLERLIVIIL